MREQYLARRHESRNLPLGPVILTTEPPVSLEDSRRMRQWSLSSPYLQPKQRSRCRISPSLTKIAITNGHSQNSHGDDF